MFEYGSNMDYQFIRSTIKNKYPEWIVIDISDNKYIQSLEYVSNDKYAVYESSATITLNVSLNGETAIENIPADTTAPRKILINGQIFILRGEKVYTLQGQEVR